MSLLRGAFVVLAAATTFSLVGCGEPAAPPAGGRGFVYVLESVDGSPLPAEISLVFFGVRMGPDTVLADTLFFGGSAFMIERRVSSTIPFLFDVSGAAITDGDSLHLYTPPVNFDTETLPIDPPTIVGALRDGRLTLESLVDPETLPLPGRVLVYRRVQLPEPTARLDGVFVLSEVDGGPLPESIPGPLFPGPVAFVAETLTVSLNRDFRLQTMTDPSDPFAFPTTGIVSAKRDSVFLRDFPLGDHGRGVVKRGGIEVIASSAWPLGGRRLWYRRVNSP